MVNRSSSGGRSAGQLNFHQLYIFQTVANHLSFSRAAEAMEITQPAVSIQVQELEKFLGVTLFHRRPRGLRITEARPNPFESDTGTILNPPQEGEWFEVTNFGDSSCTIVGSSSGGSLSAWRFSE